MKPHILLDLSRLLSSAKRPAPSGIDRVELAYAQRLLPSAEVTACAVAPWGTIGLLPHALATQFVAALVGRWQGRDHADAVQRLARRATANAFFGAGMRLRQQVARAGPAPLYLLVSHHHLADPNAIATLLARTGARFVCLVHDLIPVTHAEYARPGQPEIHRLRMETAARLAHGLIFNSRATAAQFAPFLQRAQRRPASVIAPLGLDLLPQPRVQAGRAEPYFICLGTIEPRKNHLLLLNLWRQLAAEVSSPPRLILVGRRGWENENVIDMIERCSAIAGWVEEHNVLPDEQLAPLLAGARALLLPSFAEGYGLPVAEALAAGVPVLCSDLPALREVGGDVAEYLDPLDGVAWRAAIVDYARPQSPRREAQLSRMRNWHRPEWSEHFDVVAGLMESVRATVD